MKIQTTCVYAKYAVVSEAHSVWQEFLEPHDHVIDATLGNGHDTLFLSQLLPQGHVYSYDIQEAALTSARERLKGRENVTLKLQSHSLLEESNIRLVVYNLGYLPGSDKRVTTQTETTLQSLERARQIVVPGGLLSITCYPGHEEGKREAEAVLKWAGHSFEVTARPFLLLVPL